MKHALSVDVEDWFMVLNLKDQIDRSEWERIELRCGDSTRRLLELLARRDAKATFFFLGWVAERLPDLVKEVHDAGHEIGSHGYDHRCLHELSADSFRAELQRTSKALEAITGTAPSLFRACTWSITAQTPWAVDVLLDEGITLDSSIYPIRHPDYGVAGAPDHPYRMTHAGRQLVEFPPLTLTRLGRRLPVGGGGYLRLFPLWLLKMGLRQQERRGWPACVYLHPWEVDPDQPRHRTGSSMRTFRHYVNLKRMLPKLDRLLGYRSFVGLEAALVPVQDKLPEQTLASALQLRGEASGG
ncbi:MAG: XrtA system polysaccharide deacetylase [Planctomycetota bacterium]